MIWYYLFTFFGNFLTAMFSFLPRVDELPLGMDSALSQAVGGFKAFMEIFPPLEVIFTAFMWYLGFRIVILTLKIFRILK